MRKRNSLIYCSRERGWNYNNNNCCVSFGATKVDAFKRRLFFVGGSKKCRPSTFIKKQLT